MTETSNSHYPNTDHRAPIIGVIHAAGGKVLRVVLEPGGNPQSDVTHFLTESGEYEDEQYDDIEPEHPIAC